MTGKEKPMWPQAQVVQFETRHLEVEAALGLYGDREAAAQSALNRSRRRAPRRHGLRRLLWRATPAPCASC